MEIAAVSRVEAWTSLGNAANATSALKTCDELRIPETARLRDARNAVNALGPVKPEFELRSDAPIVGTTTYKDGGAGFILRRGVLQIGIMTHEPNGIPAEGTLSFGAGSVLVGATMPPAQLNVQVGRLIFKGEKDRPVVVRNLTLACEYTGTIEAENTIFENCDFRKVGNWFWNDGYSAKFHFRNCMFVNSSFVSLSRMDYGIDIEASTFVGSYLPPRDWGYENSATPDRTFQQMYRHDWSRIANCDFHDCDVSPTSIWMATGCNFFQCVAVNPSTFVSPENMVVEIGCDDADIGFIDQLRSQTSCVGKGQVGYSRVANKQFDRERGFGLWRWAAALSLERTTPEKFILAEHPPHASPDSMSRWERVDETVWNQSYQNGVKRQFRLTEREELDGCFGSVFTEVAGQAQFFIPDCRGPKPMHPELRVNAADPWAPGGVVAVVLERSIPPDLKTITLMRFPRQPPALAPVPVAPAPPVVADPMPRPAPPRAPAREPIIFDGFASLLHAVSNELLPRPGATGPK